jgi:hypothetical protein
MGELKSRQGRPPNRGGGAGGIRPRQPIAEDARWALRSPPRPHPRPPSPLQNLLFLAFAALLIIVFNAILWRGGSEPLVVDPITGRHVDPSEP